MTLLQINTTACNGSDAFWPWFLWLLGAFILGAILGWLLKSIFGGNKDNTDWEAKYKSTKSDLDKCLNDKKSIQSDLDLCMKNKSSIQTDLDACLRDKKSLSDKAAMAASAVLSAGAAAGAKTGVVAAAAAPTKKDKLTKVEGIGPKIQEHFNNDGIWTFEELANSSIERLQGILDKAGPAYKMHNPKTWPAQSKMAAEGKWDELKKWQDELDGGK